MKTMMLGSKTIKTVILAAGAALSLAAFPAFAQSYSHSAPPNQSGQASQD